LNIFFDELNSMNRSPAGAVSDCTAVTLTVLGDPAEIESAVVCFAKDGSGASTIHMTRSGFSGGSMLLRAEIGPVQAGLYWYWFAFNTRHGTIYLDRNGQSTDISAPYQLTVFENSARNNAPSWLQGGIVYQIMVDRFFRPTGSVFTPSRDFSTLHSDWYDTPEYMPDEQGRIRNCDFFGGTLRGVCEKLPYLQSLGVTAIYLNPIFEAASNHKYDTADYNRIDPAFGTERDFKELIESARTCGMRIILDGVFNHTGDDSVYFNKYGFYPGLGAYQSINSPFYSWFSFQEWPDLYTSWWGIRTLPTLNKECGEFIDYLTGSDGIIAKWTRLGISGWRLDVVDELPDKVLAPICKSIKRENKDAMIIGEVWEDASNKIAYDVRRRYFQGGQLDSVTNYPIRSAIIQYIAQRDASVLLRELLRQQQNYPEHILNSLLNILGTHDTARIMTVFGYPSLPGTREEMSKLWLEGSAYENAKTLVKIAAALQYTLPGVPCVYYGDEAGMQGGSDPFNRACFPWDREDTELTAYYARLGELRHELTALGNGVFEPVYAYGGVFAFIRRSCEEAVYICTNCSENDYIENQTLLTHSADVCAAHYTTHYEYISKSVRDSLIVRPLSAAIYRLTGSDSGAGLCQQTNICRLEAEKDGYK